MYIYIYYICIYIIDIIKYVTFIGLFPLVPMKHPEIPWLSGTLLAPWGAGPCLREAGPGGGLSRGHLERSRGKGAEETLWSGHGIRELKFHGIFFRDFEGDNMGFDRILMQAHGVLWDLNGVSWEFNGILMMDINFHYWESSGFYTWLVPWLLST